MIEEVRAQVRYHQILGISDYPWLRETVSVSIPESLSGPPAVDSAEAAPVERLAKRDGMVGETLADIEGEIRACRRCELRAGALPPVPGRGEQRARLVLVGGWLTGSAQAAPPADTIFGMEEDRMVARMLKAIRLEGHDVYVTNVLKCVLPEDCQPVTAHIRCCLAYLHRQIAVIGPEVICCMGIDATRALLGSTRSLSQVRGRFYPCRTLDGREVPVIPTYHPTYLLRVEDMKKETWKDLQQIEKRLAS